MAVLTYTIGVRKVSCGKGPSISLMTSRCIARLIFLSLSSRAAKKGARVRREAQEYLLSGQRLLAQRNDDGAIDEYQKVLSLSKNFWKTKPFSIWGLSMLILGIPRRILKNPSTFTII
jgi:hypothetical protein